MKRIYFEKQFEQFGMQLVEYGGQCYFAESEDCSLVLAPYPAETVSKASLAIRTAGAERRNVVVSQFLCAAGVQPDSEMAEALEGHEYRGRSGSKNVTIALIDDEFFVTVAEGGTSNDELATNQ